MGSDTDSIWMIEPLAALKNAATDIGMRKYVSLRALLEVNWRILNHIRVSIQPPLHSLVLHSSDQFIIYSSFSPSVDTFVH